MQRILGTLAGLVVAFAVVFGLEALNHQLFPWPRIDASDTAGFAAALAAAPFAAKLLIVKGWFLGALLGGLAAARIGRWHGAIWIVAAFVLLAGLANILIIPHPVWMQVAAFAAPLLGGFIASRLSRARP